MRTLAEIFEVAHFLAQIVGVLSFAALIGGLFWELIHGLLVGF